MVPTSATRRRLLQEGRKKRIEFNRGMSKLEVKNTLLQSFPDLKLQNPQFVKCNSLKRLCKVNLEGFPNGDELIDISSKKSLYVIEDQIEVSNFLLVVVMCLRVGESQRAANCVLCGCHIMVLQMVDEIIIKLFCFTHSVCCVCEHVSQN